MPETLKIDRIRLDGGTQPRSTIDIDVVAEYAEAMERGDDLPPVSVIYDGDDYWLYDGFHRVRAAEKRGEFQIRAEVQQGTRRDAVLKSLSVNAQHGLRRNNADKRRAVKTMLEDEEWRKWPLRKIARHCKVSVGLVSKMHDELSVNDEQIGKPDEREVTRDGTTYTQDTSNIGSSARQSESDIAQGLEAGKEFYCKYCYRTHSHWQRGGPEYEHTDREIWECEFCDHASAAAHLSTETPDVDQSESEMQPEGVTDSSSHGSQTHGDGAPSENASSPGFDDGESGKHRAGQPAEDYVTPEEAAARAYNRIAPILEDPSRLRAELEELKKIADEIPQHVRSKLVSELEETGHEFLEFAQSIDRA